MSLFKKKTRLCGASKIIFSAFMEKTTTNKMKKLWQKMWIILIQRSEKRAALYQNFSRHLPRKIRKKVSSWLKIQKSGHLMTRNTFFNSLNRLGKEWNLSINYLGSIKNLKSMIYNLLLKLRGTNLKLLRKSSALTSPIKESRSFPFKGSLRGLLVSFQKRIME